MARKKAKSNSFNLPLVLGLILLSIFSIWRYHQARILSFNISEVKSFVSSGIKPVYIKSYPLGIDIEIKDSVIVDKVWGIHPNSANYLINSAGVGDKGNMIVYGHNKDNILGPLRWITVGSDIEILGSDNKSYKYKVVKTDIVDPDNLEYILPSDIEKLTIYTCVGFLDSKRFIAVAERINE